MRHFLNQLRVLVLKDWQLFLADRLAVLLYFIVPIVLASVFGIIFDRTGPGKERRLQLLVVVEGEQPFAKQLANALESSPRLDVERVSRDEAERRVRDQDPGVMLILDDECEPLADWKPTLHSVKPVLQLQHNPLSDAASQWAEGVVTEIIMHELARRKLGGWLEPTIGSIVPFELESTPLAHSPQAGFNSYTHSFCGATLQYLLFWGMESGLLFLRERRRSLWPRLRAAPVGTLLLSKVLSTASIAWLQIAVTLSFGHLVFGVNVAGSTVGFVLIVLILGLMVAAMGLLVAALGRTEARARSICILSILLLSLLGGLWMPAFALPEWVRNLSDLLPTAWAMRGLDLVTWQAADLRSVSPSLAMLSGFTVAFFALAMVQFVLNEARRRRGME